MHTPWPGPTMVTLLDGRMTWSDVEEWRHETLARELLDLPSEERSAILDKMRQKHGDGAVEKLLDTFNAIREAAACRPR